MPAIATVLLPSDDPGRVGPGLRLAASAARRQGADLVAIRIETRPDATADDDLPRGKRTSGQAAGSANPIQTAAPELGMPLQWETVAGDRTRIARALVDRVHAADLVVVDRWASRAADNGWITELFAQLPLLTGRPTVFVPDASRADRFGEHVMVAWNASRESSRAVSDALPILKLADDVTVLSVETPRDPSPGEAGAESRLASFLSRHGVSVTLCKSYIAGADVGDTIASRARDSRVDLVVMGAYGYRRHGQFVLGPATQYLLDHMPVPVLMSH